MFTFSSPSRYGLCSCDHVVQPRLTPQSALTGAKDLTPTLYVFWSFTFDQL